MTTTHNTTPKPPFWRDVKNLGRLAQLAVFGLVAAVIYILVNNVRTNSANLGIPVGFDFLDQPSSFTIPGNSLRETQPVRDAIFEGFLNTVRVALAGIIFATLLGVAVGVGRLSGNWLIRTLSRIFVESIRNVPLLGIVIFAYLAIVLKGLPRIQDSYEVGGLVVANNRGVAVPWITGSGWLFLFILAIATAAAAVVARWRTNVSDKTGEPANTGRWAFPLFAAIAFWGAIAIGIGITQPRIEGRQMSGGMILQPEYFALLIALVIYTASHIAEIVRGSIQAIPSGQVEASMALALSPWQRLRHIILPQAMRIAIPPLGNQYLNLLKNSSLGFAISYFELTKVVSTTIGNRSPVIPAYVVLMAIYLAMSLTISLVLNAANRRLRIEAR